MDIGSTFAALDFARLGISAAIKARDDLKIAAATQELNDTIVKAQIASLELLQKQTAISNAHRDAEDRAHQLHHELVELKRRASERERYELKKLHENTFVLSVREDCRGSEPPHYVCQPCMDNLGKKGILQGNSRLVTCPECKQKYSLAPTPSAPPVNGASNSAYLSNRKR
ncbi:hypothetical protein DBV39_00010 [Orrella marina]|uniref:Uncharacterized protein n=1 Tax=Orrella marina TaxID=2163011 RepID=A0A2R4XEX2_9BURK|nr:hypothetical protein DBV39_00010 [Orrella marina]